MSESLEEATVTTRSDMSESSEEATVTCSTSKGEFKMKFYRKWSPNGYDRAVELFESGFYDQSHFFRGERIVENPESNLCLSLATLSTDTRPRLASLISFVFIPSRTWLQHYLRRLVLPGFLVQFGISYTNDKELKKFARETIPDDPHLPELRQVNAFCTYFYHARFFPRF